MALRTKRAKVLAIGAVAGVAAALTVGLSTPSGATPAASRAAALTRRDWTVRSLSCWRTIPSRA